MIRLLMQPNLPPSVCPVPARGREARKRNFSNASRPIWVGMNLGEWDISRNTKWPILPKLNLTWIHFKTSYFMKRTPGYHGRRDWVPLLLLVEGLLRGRHQERGLLRALPQAPRPWRAAQGRGRPGGLVGHRGTLQVKGYTTLVLVVRDTRLHSNPFVRPNVNESGFYIK